MENEQKAKQIAENNRMNYYECEPGWGVNVSSSEDECYESALEAMKWKDEQFQKVLDYAEICYGVFSFEQRKNFINHIKKIFYGKE